MIHLCRNLGLQVTIEGVERPAQLDFLSICGELSVQGFLLAEAVEQQAVIGVVQFMPERLELLLQAATQNRAATIDDDLTSSIRMLRRNRR